MKLQFVVMIMATLAILANSSRHPPLPSPSSPPSLSSAPAPSPSSVPPSSIPSTPASSPSYPPSSISSPSPSSVPPSSSPAPPPASADCTTLMIDGMMDCLDYLGIYSNSTNPSESCCSGLQIVVDTNASCLCEGLNSASGMGILLNMTRASDLPVVCKVNVPPSARNCKVSPAPGASPAGSPNSSSPELSPEEPPTSPSTKPPSKPPSKKPAPSSAPTAPTPAKAGAHAISVSFFGLISLFVVSFSVILL